MNIALFIVSLVFFIGVFAPLIPSNHWIVRFNIYLRSTYLMINIIILVFSILFQTPNAIKIVTIGLLLTSISMGIRSIYPFTFLAKKTLLKAKNIIDEKGLKLFIFNVYQFNDNYQKCIDEILDKKPDIVFLVETDVAWYEKLSVLETTYPFVIKEIRNDTYGLVCFSKIPFNEHSIKYIVTPEIPSIEFLINIDNQLIRIFGVHPEPPSPTESTYSTKKDRELIEVSKQISGISLDEEAILIGDFNDVAWSRISTKIKNITKMVDPREGRGFYSTFPTKSPFKIPLDHIFCSTGFELVSFKVLDNIGSDHYPVFIHLQLK